MVGGEFSVFPIGFGGVRALIAEKWAIPDPQFGTKTETFVSMLREDGMVIEWPAMRPPSCGTCFEFGIRSIATNLGTGQIAVLWKWNVSSLLAPEYFGVSVASIGQTSAPTYWQPSSDAIAASNFEDLAWIGDGLYVSWSRLSANSPSADVFLGAFSATGSPIRPAATVQTQVATNDGRSHMVRIVPVDQRPDGAVADLVLQVGAQTNWQIEDVPVFADLRLGDHRTIAQGNETLVDALPLGSQPDVVSCLGDSLLVRSRSSVWAIPGACDGFLSYARLNRTGWVAWLPKQGAATNISILDDGGTRLWPCTLPDARPGFDSQGGLFLWATSRTTPPGLIEAINAPM